MWCHVYIVVLNLTGASKLSMPVSHWASENYLDAFFWDSCFHASNLNPQYSVLIENKNRLTCSLFSVVFLFIMGAGKF